MTISWTERRGLTHARVKIGVPWPVDPAQYPLNGPSSGPVYVPTLDTAEQAIKVQFAQTPYGGTRKPGTRHVPRWVRNMRPGLLRSYLMAVFLPCRADKTW